MAGFNHARRNFARTFRLERHPLGAITAHPQTHRLDIQDDVSDILANAWNRRKLMQDTVNLHGGNRRPMQGRQQHPP